MSSILQMLDEYRFVITIGLGAIVIVVLLVFLLFSSKKAASDKKTKDKTADAVKRRTGDDTEEFMNVDSNGLPLDDDDGEYRDSNLFGKSKKATKEEYYKDWD